MCNDLRIKITVTLFLILLATFTESTSEIIIKIKNGKIKGRKNVTVGQGREYFNFRGIPYAEPPIGNLRFAPPVPKSNWSNILNATEDKNQCVQMQGLFSVSGVEDCLYLNVYTPRNPLEKCQLLPTLVWIVGGAFITGNSTYRTNGPDFLLENDIVVVTFNYRLSIFGFSSTEDAVNPGNNALRDQQLVLEWVRDNIKYFCGDPNQVTLSGGSAGAACVGFHLHANKSQGLFHRAIMSSGTPINQWALNREGAKLTRAVAEQLGIDRNDTLSLINKLRSISADELQEATNSASLQYFLEERLNFSPVSEVEVGDNGNFFTGNSFTLLSQGAFSRVPVMIGFDSLEIFLDTSDAMFQSLFNSFETNPEKFLSKGLADMDPMKKREAAKKIQRRYFGLKSVSESEYQMLKFLSDDYFIRGVVKYGNLIKAYTDVYVYEFVYTGGLSGFYNRKYNGVRHSEEICYYWRCYHEPEFDDDLRIREYVVRLLSNFIKTGNPTSNFDNFTWNKYNDANRYLEIGEKLVMRRNPNGDYTKFWDDIFDRYAKKPLIVF